MYLLQFSIIEVDDINFASYFLSHFSSAFFRRSSLEDFEMCFKNIVLISSEIQKKNCEKLYLSSKKLQIIFLLLNFSVNYLIFKFYCKFFNLFDYTHYL
jgi:hypothetical protein